MTCVDSLSLSIVFLDRKKFRYFAMDLWYYEFAPEIRHQNICSKQAEVLAMFTFEECW